APRQTGEPMTAVAGGGRPLLATGCLAPRDAARRGIFAPARRGILPAMTRPAARPFVLALGVNAISPTAAAGDLPHQFATTRRTAGRIADLVAAGHRPLLTHGNGPQVGNVLRRVELAAHEVYTLPLQTCVADTQGGMGYMIAE